MRRSNSKKASIPEEHQLFVIAWGNSVWNAYAEFHDEIIETYEEFVKNYHLKKRKKD